MAHRFALSRRWDWRRCVRKRTEASYPSRLTTYSYDLVVTFVTAIGSRTALNQAQRKHNEISSVTGRSKCRHQSFLLRIAKVRVRDSNVE